MSDFSWLSPENLDPAKLALELAKAVSRWDAFKHFAARNKDRLLNGETQIAVVGAGGTGKTTFSSIVTAENPLIVDSKYVSDVTQKHVKFPGGLSAKLLVAPGQERYVDEVWPKIFERLEKARDLAIVNVVAYGYHAFDLQSFEDFAVYKEGMTNEEFLLAYLKERRAVELEGLAALREGLSQVERDTWMLTVVSKQDLWWADKEAVTNHYQSEADGHYGAQIKAIEQDFQDRGYRFSHHFVPSSQVVSNFTGPKGEQLKLTAEGYDLDEHVKYLYNYVRRFNDLLEGNKL